MRLIRFDLDLVKAETGGTSLLQQLENAEVVRYTVYKTTKCLKEEGFSYYQALKIVNDAPFDRSGFSDEAIEDLVRDAYFEKEKNA